MTGLAATDALALVEANWSTYVAVLAKPTMRIVLKGAKGRAGAMPTDTLIEFEDLPYSATPASINFVANIYEMPVKITMTVKDADVCNKIIYILTEIFKKGYGAGYWWTMSQIHPDPMLTYADDEKRAYKLSIMVTRTKWGTTWAYT